MGVIKMQKKKRDTTLKFLMAIEGEEHGITGEALQAALSLPHTRAIGSRSLLVRRVLASLDYDPATVFATEKRFNEKTRWFPRSRIAEAIEAVQNMGEDV